VIQKKLKKIIEKEGTTPNAIAKAIGVDHASLYRSLRNGGNPEWKTIKKVLDHLGYEIRIVKSRRKEMKLAKSKSRKEKKKG
jgi:probable addiction module antidote protein